MWIQLLTLFAIIYVIKRILLFRGVARGIGNTLSYRTLLSPDLLASIIVPKMRGISPGKHYFFVDKHSVYNWAGCDILGHVSMFPSKALIYVADPTAIKEISTNRTRFQKPVERYSPLSIYGYNIVASEGEDWKRYRKVCAPHFAERNNRLVCSETIVAVNDIFDNAWENKDQIVVDNFLDITLSITLSVISATVFGHRTTWKDDEAIPSGHQMSFNKSFHMVASNAVYRVLLPDWVMPLTEKTRQIDLAFKELKSYMLDFMEAQGSEKHDILSLLLEADTSESNEGLSASELMGNFFIFLIAGHQSSAGAVCYALALLALDQDEQEKLFQQTKSVVKNPQAPAYDEIPLLTRTLAVFYEVLRMYPVVPVIPKRSVEDTSLTVTNNQGDQIVVPIPKGTLVHIDAVATHYNPKYWEDPYSFKPDRFLQPDWNRDAFLPFSAGARACLGRRFAEIEVIVAITMIITQYKITLTDEFLSMGETLQQRRDRLLKSTNLLNLLPVRVPLVFTRRS